MSSRAPILIIDDELALLQSVKRQLQETYEISTASSGREALKLLKSQDEFGVVIADMMMPEMNGIEVLRKVRALSPNTIRIMFTGHAEPDMITSAVNEGGVFKFLEKPVPREVMTLTLDAALEKYNARRREVELLEHTVAGAISIFVDLLSANLKNTFAAQSSLRDWAKLVAKELGYTEAWQWDLAAMLCQVGVLQLDRDLVDKIERGDSLTEAENKRYKQSPLYGRDLICKVPRFKTIADIVCYQNYAFDGTGPKLDNVPHLEGTNLPLGARVLRILKDVYAFSDNHLPNEQVFSYMEETYPGRYDTALFIATRAALLQDDDKVTRGKKMETMEVALDRLNAGDNLLANIIMKEDERVVLGAGVTLTESHIKKLRTVNKLHDLNEPFSVMRLVLS